MKKNLKKGFTLIELLVVISVIGLLAALIVVNFNAARERARDVQRKSDLDQTKKALRMYYNDYGEYPEADSGKIRGCSNPLTTFVWGEGSFMCNAGQMTYMKLLPQDPVEDETYTYAAGATDQDFCLSAILENKSDADIATSQTRCSGCGGDEDDYVVCAD